MPQQYALKATLLQAEKIVAKLKQAKSVKDLAKIELQTQELHADVTRLVIDCLLEEITIDYVRTT